ncbi:MAG TPA: hypothetical protein VFW12_07125 [Candidatus Limnocylindria bacterium]|nr:hypothetical protein [Candidatus Limnocylindria bacterium]
MSDPLAELIGRSLRTEVSDVRSEIVRRDPHVELERVRYVAGGLERSLILKRVPRERDLEVHLLPFLARKSAHVPRVHSRGIPPPAVPAKRWLLLDDTVDAPSACDADPRAIVEAKVAIERAVAGDAPALRALGVPELPPAAIAALAPPELADDAAEAARRLAGWPTSLVHGDLVCENTSLADGEVRIGEWRWAHLGCALLDVVRLTGDLVERGEAVLGIALSRVYGGLVDRQIGTDELRAAELLERVVAGQRRD